MNKCEACGFGLVILEHHPNGRLQEAIVHKGKFAGSRRIPVNPDNVNILCPNCHALVHWKNKSINRAGYLTRKFWREKIRLYDFHKYWRMWNTMETLIEFSGDDKLKEFLGVVENIEREFYINKSGIELEEAFE